MLDDPALTNSSPLCSRPSSRMTSSPSSLSSFASIADDSGAWNVPPLSAPPGRTRASARTSLQLDPRTLDLRRIPQKSIHKRHLTCHEARARSISSAAFGQNDEIYETSVMMGTPFGDDRSTASKQDRRGYFVLLARQEQRVLELREELSRAEAYLKQLKSHWAASSQMTPTLVSAPKSTTSPPVPRPRGISSPHASSSHSTKPVAAALNETELRQTETMQEPWKRRPRRTFSGSRHTRTLSLLALPQKSLTETDTLHIPGAAASEPLVHPHIGASARPRLLRADSASTAQEDLLKHGRQLAAGFKDGLWTFLEDLRQVAVGDDARQTMLHDRDAVWHAEATTSAGLPSTSPDGNTRRSSQGTRISDAQHAVHQSRTCTPRQHRVYPQTVDGETWDMWETPSPKRDMNRSAQLPVKPRTVEEPQEPTAFSANEASPSREDSNEQTSAWPNIGRQAASFRRKASDMLENWDKAIHNSAKQNGGFQAPDPTFM